MGIRARTKVYGLFAGLLPRRGQAGLSQLPLRQRQGLVPDFLVSVPSAASDATVDTLFELKTLHLGTSTYPPHEERRCSAVHARARGLPAEYSQKARRLDRSYCGTAEDAVGPAEQRLLGYGPVAGLVFGHWAEASPHVETLLATCAKSGSARHWRSMHAQDAAEAYGTLMWMLRRRWGMCAWRSAARLLLDRLEYVGGVRAMAAAGRRTAARAAAADSRRHAGWLFQSLRRRAV